MIDERKVLFHSKDHRRPITGQRKEWEEAEPLGTVTGGLPFEGVERIVVPLCGQGEVKDGERICVRRPPFNMLWTDVFHAPRHYTVVEAENPEDCGDVRDVDSLGHP